MIGASKITAEQLAAQLECLYKRWLCFLTRQTKFIDTGVPTAILL
jgi:hypothetical protein